MFKINGERWEIDIVSPKSEYLKRSDNTYTIGACDYLLHKIFISSGLSPVFLKRVLCHEITHAAMFSYGISLSLEQEELVADLIATYGEQIIQVTEETLKKIKGVA